MRLFFSSKRFKILISVLAALLLGAIFAVTSKNGSSPLSSIVGTVFSPVHRLSAYVSEQMGDFSGAFVSSSTYAKRVDELEKQIEQYQQKLIDYEKYKQKIEIYEEFLDVKEENPDFVFEPGTIIGRDASDLFYSFVLNKGSSDGVSVNAPVISGRYLVGIVVRVTPFNCVVNTILDPKVNVGAYEVRTRETGFVTSTVELSKDAQCRLSGLVRTTSIASGGIVCTSGVGGVYPRDLIIGTVKEIRDDEHDISSYAVINPGVDIANLQEAFIITYFDGQGISESFLGE